MASIGTTRGTDIPALDGTAAGNNPAAVRGQLWYDSTNRRN
mgnify:CR=1 FL=1